MTSPSPARNGNCACRSGSRPGRGRSSPRRAALSCGAAVSRSARSTCRSTGPTGSASPGPNGAGKTTLLDALLGRIPLDEGYAALGPGVVVGEIDQARGAFLGAEPLLDAFGAAVPALVTADIRTLLAKFGLRAAHVLRPAGTLSPGERTRAALALLQARGANLLVLDEPTNHLDLPAIEQLESALASYPGTLILVTHDRRMLEAVATSRRIEVADGRVTDR